MKTIEMKKQEEEIRTELVQECKEYINDAKYMKKCLKINKDYAIEIQINGKKIGVVDSLNDKVIEVLNDCIKEAKKCIKGKPNNYD